MVGRDCIWVDLRNFGQTPFGWAVGQGSISTQSGKKVDATSHQAPLKLVG